MQLKKQQSHFKIEKRYLVVTGATENVIQRRGRFCRIILLVGEQPFWTLLSVSVFLNIVPRKVFRYLS